MDNKIVVYTDGSCNPNPGRGGWAYAEKTGINDVGLYDSGFEEKSTNNRMEYQACIEAIRAFATEGLPIEIVSDSKLLISTCEQWRHGWKRKGWKRSGGPIKNLDLVQELDLLLEQVEVTFRWIRGHSGDFHNDFVDRLANAQSFMSEEL